MASVIVSNTGSLVLNDGSSTVPKGGYTVSTSNDKVYVKSGSVTWTLDFNDTTLDGNDYGSAKELASALSDFSRGGSGPGPEPGDAVWGGITGTLSDQLDLQIVLNSKADSSSLGTAATADVGDFATAAQGALADTAVQPAALSSYVPTTRTVNGQALTANISLTNTDVGAAATSHTHPSTQISDSTATGRSVLTAASAAAARTAIGAGTSNLALGTTGSTALAGNTPVVKSQQESGVGTLISNIIQVTQTQYDGLTPQAGTFYAIVG